MSRSRVTHSTSVIICQLHFYLMPSAIFVLPVSYYDHQNKTSNHKQDQKRSKRIHLLTVPCVSFSQLPARISLYTICPRACMIALYFAWSANREVYVSCCSI